MNRKEWLYADVRDLLLDMALYYDYEYTTTETIMYIPLEIYAGMDKHLVQPVSHESTVRTIK